MSDKIERSQEKTEREQMVDEYIAQMNPQIRQSLDHQQSSELSRFLNRVLPLRGKHLVNLKFSFWLIKNWYFVLQFGMDKRDTKRLRKSGAAQTLLAIILNTIFVIILAALIFILVFYLLYLLKSTLGIDIFPNRHLSDILRGKQISIFLEYLDLTNFRFFQVLS